MLNNRLLNKDSKLVFLVNTHGSFCYNIFDILLTKKYRSGSTKKKKGVRSQIDFGQSVGESSMLSYEPNH